MLDELLTFLSAHKDSLHTLMLPLEMLYIILGAPILAEKIAIGLHKQEFETQTPEEIARRVRLYIQLVVLGLALPFLILSL